MRCFYGVLRQVSQFLMSKTRMIKSGITRITVISIAITIGAIACSVAEPHSAHFSVNISTAQQEADYTCDLIEGIDYFTSRGYTPEFPDHPLIDSMVEESSQGRFDRAQCASLDSLFEEDIYQARLYNRPYRRVIRALPALDQAHDVFMQYNQKWDFRTFDHYEILLTLYGPGGMFDTKTGKIWLMITDAGSFKMGDDPANVIVHEAVHIGLDEPIVERFGLSQGVTEHLVDRFITDHFHDLLPDYEAQELGDLSIDPYLNHPDSWERLPEYIAQYASSR